MFQRKHYEFIATALKTERKFLVDCGLSESIAGLDMVATRLSEAFHKDNPRFDRTRFLEACNVI